MRPTYHVLSKESSIGPDNNYGAAVDALHREIAKRITATMKRKKLSVNHLADYAGIGRGYLSELLRGKKAPTVKTLAKIAAALDVDLRDLIPSTRT